MTKKHLAREKRQASAPRLRGKYQEDPFYKRRGSFKGPKDLSLKHDRYLYGDAEWPSQTQLRRAPVYEECNEAYLPPASLRLLD